MRPGSRILVLNLRDLTNPDAGGAEEHLHQLFGRLAARGHGITLHCAAYPGGARTDSLDGMRIVRRGGRLTNALWSVWYYARHHREFDLVVDYTCQLHFLTPLYARLPRVAMALHIVGDVYSHDLPWPIGQLFAAYEKASLRIFYGKEYFVAISPSTAQELLTNGIRPERLEVIPAGRREPAPPRDLPQSTVPTLLYHGRLKRYKGVHLLIDAMPAVKAAVPGVKLEVVGGGDQLEALRRQVATLGLEDTVTLHGFLSSAERWRTVCSAWVNVLPSLKEGWPLSVMEAAQCGIPTVATNGPGLRDVVRDGVTGELFERENRVDLENRLIRLLTDADLRRRYATEGREWADGFTWDGASEALEAMLDRCLREQAGLVPALPPPSRGE